MDRSVVICDLRRGGLLAMLPLLPFFFLFIGDFQLPIGHSALTVPMGMTVVLLMLLISLGRPCIRIPTAALLLLGVLAFGAAGLLLTPEAGVLRGAAGAMPLVYAIAALVAYSQIRSSLDIDRALLMMLRGGLILAVATMVLCCIGLVSPRGDYYATKLLIETPLGRSNYLSAFLLFLFALALALRPAWAGLLALAVLATLSRGGALMLLLFLVAMPLARRGKLWLVGALPLLAFFVCLFLLVSGHYEMLAQMAGPYAAVVRSVFNRMLLWLFGYDLWLQSPFFGVGPNTFRTFVEMHPGIEDVWGVHNSILQLLLNYGLCGTLLYCAYLRTIYRHLCLAERADPAMWYLRVVFVVLMVFSLFEPLVGSAAFEMLLALLFIVAIGKSSLNRG